MKIWISFITDIWLVTDPLFINSVSLVYPVLGKLQISDMSWLIACILIKKWGIYLDFHQTSNLIIKLCRNHMRWFLYVKRKLFINLFIYLFIIWYLSLFR